MIFLKFRWWMFVNLNTWMRIRHKTKWWILKGVDRECRGNLMRSAFSSKAQSSDYVHRSTSNCKDFGKRFECENVYQVSDNFKFHWVIAQIKLILQKKVLLHLERYQFSMYTIRCNQNSTPVILIINSLVPTSLQKGSKINNDLKMLWNGLSIKIGSRNLLCSFADAMYYDELYL